MHVRRAVLVAFSLLQAGFGEFVSLFRQSFDLLLGKFRLQLHDVRRTARIEVLRAFPLHYTSGGVSQFLLVVSPALARNVCEIRVGRQIGVTRYQDPSTTYVMAARGVPPSTDRSLGSQVTNAPREIECAL